MNSDSNINDILYFWFGELNKGKICREDKKKLWWSKSHEMDHYIRNKYGKFIGLILSNHLSHWLQTPTGTLAYIIILDQFSRHIFRNSEKAFSQDAMALESCISGMKNGFDKKLHPIERIFFYMPLMHSEDPKLQNLSIEKYSALETEFISDPDLHIILSESKGYAERHFDVIEKFSRFPHRNKALGRESTPEENEFLLQPENSF